MAFFTSLQLKNIDFQFVLASRMGIMALGTIDTDALDG